MALTNRVMTATFTGVTMGTVIDVSASFPAGFNSTLGGGSLNPLSVLRSVTGQVSVRYQTTGAPCALDAAVASLTVVCKDETASDQTITYPYMKPAGSAFSIGTSDLAVFQQDFIQSAPLGTAISSLAPTVS